MQGSALSSRGYNVLKTDLSNDEITAIKNELSVVPFVPGGPNGYRQQQVAPNKLYMESDTRIYVPKCYGLTKWGPPTQNKLSPGKEVNLTFCGNLREEQEPAVSSLLAACHSPRTMGGVLNVFCGGGKTTMALYVAVKLARKTLIVVHKDFLLEQWKERIQQFIPGARIGSIKAKVIDCIDKDIVIASLQSLSMKEYDSAIFTEFGTVIVDEVHHTSAEVFSKALKKISFVYTIGLSATIQRKDGLAKVLLWYLGPIAFKATKRQDDVNVKIVQYFDNTTSYCEVPFIGSKPNVARMINNVCAHAPRDQVIMQLLRNLLKDEPSRRILVLSDRRAHLYTLMSMVDDTITKGIYVGGMKPETLNQERQVMFATFAIASEGYDQPGLDTLVLASPRSDVTQSVGRILRDKACDRRNMPLVIDIVDMFSLFVNQGNKRKAFYKSCGYNIATGTNS